MKAGSLPLFLFGLLFSGGAWGFPEMIRHNYTSCMTCHVSPNGGGLLTPYGRSMSKEILSRWSDEGEERLFHGALEAEKLNSWLDGSKDVGLNLGGDIRWVQSHRENSEARERRSILMQAEVEGALQIYQLTLTGSYGRFPVGRDQFVEKSRRWSAILKLNDNLSLRVGRFLPSYGMLVPEHIYLTRKELGFDQGFERNNLELAWIGEVWNIFATHTRDPEGQLFQEQGGSLRIERNFNENKKWAVSVYRGQGPVQERLLWGADLQWTFSHDLVSWIEISSQQVKNSRASTQTWVGMSKTSWEVTRGLFLQAIYERSYRDILDTRNWREGYGPGFQFFPRPHFEISGHWIHRHDAQISSRTGDEAYLLLHYYL